MGFAMQYSVGAGRSGIVDAGGERRAHPDGRRARKIVEVWSGGAWQPHRTHQYLYDRRNLIEETITQPHSQPSHLLYTWGLDLAGLDDATWSQDAGVPRHSASGATAGGIAEITGTSTNVFLAVSDQVGTVHALVAAMTDGVVLAEPFVAARYEYSPYGELLEVETAFPPTSVLAANPCPVGFQSKVRDAETGFWYFGYRFFDSRSAQWLTHDPIAEAGGFNLAAFCGGDPVNQVDPLGLWVLDGNIAVAEKSDTLSGLGQILGIEWQHLPFQGDPHRLPIGQRIDVGQWVQPLRDTLEQHANLSEALLSLRIHRMAYADSIQKHTDRRGRYNPADVSRSARDRRDLYEKAVAAVSLAEGTVDLLRAAEAGRRFYLVDALAKATDRQKLALHVVRRAETGRSLRVTKTGVGLGVVSAGFDAYAAWQLFDEGNVAGGVHRTSTASVTVWGICFPPAAVASGMYSLVFDPLLSYTIGGGDIDRRTRQSVIDNDMLYYQRIPRLIEAVSGRLMDIEPEVQRAHRVFQQLIP